MKSVPVFAVADSRLHADVMLIRLRRADIPCGSISAFFPRRSVPNAIACWLPLHERLSLKVGKETFSAAGKIHGALKPLLASGVNACRLFEAAGLDRVSAHRLEAKLDQGHILLAVSAHNESEASVAWHVFKHAGAGTIIVGSETVVTSAEDRPSAGTPALAAAA
jgi:hypothetical protein